MQRSVWNRSLESTLGYLIFISLQIGQLLRLYWISVHFCKFLVLYKNVLNGNGCKLCLLNSLTCLTRLRLEYIFYHLHKRCLCWVLLHSLEILIVLGLDFPGKSISSRQHILVWLQNMEQEVHSSIIFFMEAFYTCLLGEYSYREMLIWKKGMKGFSKDPYRKNEPMGSVKT